jgi:hypothetical protein
LWEALDGRELLRKVKGPIEVKQLGSSKPM